MASGSPITDSVVSLVKAGVIVTSTNLASATIWPTSLMTATYGGAANLWGSTWTPAEINDAGFGVALVAGKAGGGPETATVDYMQITVNYTFPGATTSVDCGSGRPVVTVGSPITCMATVSRLVGPNTPTGTVSWTSSGAGSFATSPCTLIPGGDGSSTCSVNYTPGAIGSGSHVITATYSGDAAFAASTGSQAVSVLEPPALEKTAAPSTYSAVGEVVYYTYVITNTTSVTLPGPMAVTDDKALVTCPPGDLAPGASIACSASHTITQADLDVGSLTNTATAHANGPIYSNSAQATVTAVQNPALALLKTAAPGAYSAVGDIVSYSYVLTNTGNITLAGPVTVTDDMALVTCPPGGLTPGNWTICIASHTITQADLDLGSLTNTAQGHASFGGNPVNSNSAQATVTALQSPALALAKTAAPGTYSAVGDIISYTYVLTNTGNVTLPDPLTVTDDQATVSCTVGSLAPGISTTCSASHSITQADLDAGSLTNTAQAHALFLGNPLNSNNAQATVTALQSRALALAKTAAPNTYSAVGDVINYSYVVTNTGNVTLDGPVTVTDDQVTVTCPPDSLAPGISTTCSASHTITQADLDAGSLTNTAAAHANGTDSNTASQTVTALQSPALALAKAATPGTYSAVGDVISYSYVVTNTGNVTLPDPFTVTDDKATVTCSPGSLAPAASTTCSASYSITQTDLDFGSLTNTAQAHALFHGSAVDSNSAQATVTALQSALLALQKTATPNTYSAVGDVISYSYVLTNTGNVTLDGPVTVTDDKATVTCPEGGLAPGISMTCSASYSITQADLDAGSLTNTATAHAGVAVFSNPAQATVTALQSALLALQKTATPGAYSAAGDVISYSYVVTNTGNVTLDGPVTVTDDKATVTCPEGGLAPGASTTCTASHSITQADLDLGSLTNTATAHANGADSNTASQTVTAVQRRALALAKTGTPSTYSAVGAVISYSYVVTNTGNVTLAGPVTVTDDKALVTCPSGDLAPGVAMTCGGSHSIVQADLDGGSLTSTATAHADGVDSNTASHTATAVQSPALALLETAEPSIYRQVGDVINYSYVVTNTGNVTLTGPVTVTDDKALVTCPSGDLAPAVSITCSASYTIVQADIDARSVTNTALGHALFAGNPVVSNNAQATVTLYRLYVFLPLITR